MNKNFNPNDILLIAGLGNPEERYAETFHNVGTDFVDFLANAEIFSQAGKKNFLYLKKNDLVLIIPQTFMNVSGLAIKEALKYFKTKPESIAVAHDDSDIEMGKFKISFGRGSAGHKGVESIIAFLGTKKFWRIRIGTRKTTNKRKAGDFVLKKITEDDRTRLEKVFFEIKKLFENPAD